MKPVPSVLAAPWAIEPRWLRVVFGVWSRGQLDTAALTEAREKWDARKLQRPRLDEQAAPIEGTGGTLRIFGATGVLSIEGPLFRHADIFTDISGGTSYDALARGLEVALAARGVQSILLRVSSPGGEADGVNELGKAIAEARAHKPVWTYVDGMCASAAYWLASQSDHIVAEETSESGSIGVRVGLVDYSAHDQMHGIREIEIISSQSPGKRSKPVDDEMLGRIQTRIDDLAAIFVTAVASGRGVDEEKVLADFGQGDVMIASKAVAAGLIDEIGNFESTLAALAATTSSQQGATSARARTRAMTMKDKPTAGDAPEWQCAGCNEMMGPSAKKYCAKCSEDEGDDDDDEEEAKALGLDPKAKAADRRARMVALVGLEERVFALVSQTTHAAAIAALATSVQAAARVPELDAKLAKLASDDVKRTLRASLERGLMGAPGEAPRLSLGALQKTVPMVLRGEAKKTWLAAMDKLAADADAAKKTLTASQIIDAACSVALSTEDVEAIGEYVQKSAPVAAGPYVEPERDPEKEGQLADKDAKRIDAAVKRTNAMLDRGKPKKTPPDGK